jgi:hypothetical protein
VQKEAVRFCRMDPAARRGHTVSRTRPFALRRARTFRPCLVLIRLRNPWSRFRFSFDGCLYVNDMSPLPPDERSQEKTTHYMSETRGSQFESHPARVPAHGGSVLLPVVTLLMRHTGVEPRSGLWQSCV